MNSVNSGLCKSEKLWKGAENAPVNTSKVVSFGEILIRAMKQNLDRVAQICYDEGDQLTNREMIQLIFRCALNLRDLGLVEGDVIGVATKNEKILAPIVVAAFTLGLPVNAVNWSYKKEDIQHMFGITRPKVIICCLENFPTIMSVITDIGFQTLVYVIDADMSNGNVQTALELLKSHAEEETFVPPQISDAFNLPVTICCSSGTTGPAKGVEVSHALLAYQSESFCKDGDVFFSFSTLDWQTGICGLCSCLLYSITRVITTQPFNPHLMSDIIDKHKVKTVFSSPSHLAFMTQQNIHNTVQEWRVGGSKVSPSLCEAMNKLLPNGRVVLVYGSSEMGGIVSQSEDNYDSVGRLTQGITAKIMDDDGNSLGINNQGEIWLRSCVPMMGYYKDPNATKRSFKNSWWQTGDIGYFDNDNNLHIVDRKKDIIKYMGHQVEPSEIENIIQTLSGVKLVAVVGVPDPIYVDLPAAVILKNEGSQLTKEIVQELVQNKLSNHKWLRGGVHFVPSMPMTHSGKIVKRALRDQILSM